MSKKSLLDLVGAYGIAIKDWSAGDTAAGARLIAALDEITERISAIRRAANAVRPHSSSAEILAALNPADGGDK